jgi:hypothetical protein
MTDNPLQLNKVFQLHQTISAGITLNVSRSVAESHGKSLYNEIAGNSGINMAAEHLLMENTIIPPEYCSLPVEVIAEPLEALPIDAKLTDLLRKLSLTGFVPVLNGKRRLLGYISDEEVLLSPEAQLEQLRTSSVSPLVEVSPPLRMTDSVERAAHFFAQSDRTWIPVVDAEGRYTGRCVSRTKLYKLLHGLLKPPRIGGLATPLGVYMTSGYHSAGAGWKGLVATGMLFGGLVHVLDWLTLNAFQYTAIIYPSLVGWGEGQLLILQAGLSLVCLLALLRLSPISGLHAAEHMTINAIENDLQLTEPLIRTQSREHARCGTNLMVLLGGFELLGIFLTYYWQAMNPIGLMLYTGIWALLVFRFWQPAGLWVQRHFTTKTPTSAQLASGIKAGEELLSKFQAKPHAMPSLLRRLWGSGMLHMIVSFLVTAWLLEHLLEIIGIR